jgi:DNA-binding PadR family transcriptional regulator
MIAGSLLTSLRQGPMTGGEMIPAAHEVSGGRVRLSVAGLFSTLDELVDADLIEAAPGDGGWPRPVYRLTSYGEEAIIPADRESLRLHGRLRLLTTRILVDVEVSVVSRPGHGGSI